MRSIILGDALKLCNESDNQEIMFAKKIWYFDEDPFFLNVTFESVF